MEKKKKVMFWTIQDNDIYFMHVKTLLKTKI